MLVRSATEPAQSLAAVAPDVPSAIAQVIDRALAFNKRDRWPSATAMREALVRAESAGRSDDDPEGEEDRTHIAMPPKMTLRGEDVSSLGPGIAKETLEITTLPLPPASTVAGIESHSQPGRTRRGLPFVGVAVGGVVLSGMLVALIVALAGGSKQPAAITTEPTAANPHVSSNEAASASPLPAAASSTATVARPSASEPPLISFEALPVAPPNVPATVTKAPSLTVLPVTTTRTASSAATFQASPHVTPSGASRPRDPLAP